MKIETTYTVGKVKHISCWSDLEIHCEDGSRIIVPMSTSSKENLGKTLLDRVKTDNQRKLESLQRELEKATEAASE